MKLKSLVSAGGFAAICLLSVSGYAACELETTRSTADGIYSMGSLEDSKDTTCNLNDLYSELDQVVSIKPSIQLKLPNLFVSAIDYTETFGRSIDYAISVEVSNDGLVQANTPQVAIVVNVIGEPGASGIDRQEVYLERLPSIPAGGSVRIPVTTIPMPPAKNGHTIQVIAVADPATLKRAGGEIWESDESDNQAVRNITTYGF